MNTTNATSTFETIDVHCLDKIHGGGRICATGNDVGKKVVVDGKVIVLPECTPGVKLKPRPDLSPIPE